MGDVYEHDVSSSLIHHVVPDECVDDVPDCDGQG